MHGRVRFRPCPAQLLIKSECNPAAWPGQSFGAFWEHVWSGAWQAWTPGPYLMSGFLGPRFSPAVTKVTQLPAFPPETAFPDLGENCFPNYTPPLRKL